MRKTSSTFRLKRMLDACGSNSLANIDAEEAVSINQEAANGPGRVSIVLTDDRQTEVHDYCRQTTTLRPCSLFLAGDVSSRGEIQTNQSVTSTPSTTITTLKISSICEGVNSPSSVSSTLLPAPPNVCAALRKRSEQPGPLQLSSSGEQSVTQRTPSERDTNDPRCRNDCHVHLRNFVAPGDKPLFASCPYEHLPPFLSSSLQRMPSDCDPDVVQTCALCRAADYSISQSRQLSVSGHSVRY